MESSTESRMISCHVAPLYNAAEPEDNTSPLDLFSFEIATKFINFSDHETFLLERDMVLDDDQESSRENIHDILLEMHVPVHEDEAMLDKILNTARNMASSDRCVGRKLLRLKIEISVALSVDDDEDSEDYYEDDESALNLTPATDSSIKALEKVHVDTGMNLQQQHCVVCLQQFLIGSDATRLPCTHVYHDQCIRDWLKTSGVCPLCRFRIV